MTSIDEIDTVEQELAEARAQCDELGIKYHHRSGVDTLRKQIEEHAAAESQPQEPVAPARTPKKGEHPCGLPDYMVKDRTRMGEYVNNNGVTHAQRRAIEFTESETAAYALYIKTTGIKGADRRYFTAARRLWANGVADKPAVQPDITKMVS